VRDRSLVTIAALAAMGDDDQLDQEWVMQFADAVAYSPHLRKLPLRGVPAKPLKPGPR